MKIIYKKFVRLLSTFIINIVLIIVFAIIYLNISSEFISTYGEKHNITFLDCLMTSTTVQAGVGITNIMPITIVSKIALIIHQILMITTHLLSIAFILVM